MLKNHIVQPSNIQFLFVNHISVKLEKNKIRTIIGIYYVLRSVGEGNLLPQNVSLACELFLAKNNQGPRDSGRKFDFSPNCLKNVEDRSSKGTGTIDNYSMN